MLVRAFLSFIIVSLAACAATGGAKKAPMPIAEIGPPTNDVMYNLLLAELAISREMVDVAAVYYVAVAESTRDPEIAARAVRVASFAKNNADALKAAEIWVAAAPNNNEALEVLGVLYLRNDQFEKARDILQRLLDESKSEKDIGGMYLGMGALLQREAEPTAAHEMAQHLIKNHETVPEAQYFAASLALRVGKKEEALKHVDQSLIQRKDWEQAVLLKARILETMDRIDDALDLMQAFLKRNANANEARNYYANLLLNNRQYKEARGQYELLAIKTPEDVDVLFALAVLALEFKEVDIAEGYLKQIDKLGKRTDRETYFLGQVAEEKKNYEQAIEWYSRVLRGQFYLKSQLRIGGVLAQTKSLDVARKHLHAINTHGPEARVEVLRYEGSLIKDAKQFQQAFDFYTASLKELKDNTELMYDRALVAERLDKVDLAVKDLIFIVERHPDNAAALNALGYTLADRTDRYQEAHDYIEKALKLQPNDPAILDSMGWVLYRLGKSAEAVTYLQQALDAGEDGDVAAHLGEVLWALGRKDDARKVWQSAAKKFADNKVLIGTMGRFGQ